MEGKKIKNTEFFLPTDIMIFLLCNSFITDKAFGISGANVMQHTLFKSP